MWAWVRRILAWFRPQPVERFIEPEPTDAPDGVGEKRFKSSKPRRRKYHPRARSITSPGPVFPSMVNHPFMSRTKASRLQTLGQKNVRGNYIIETDPPDRGTVVRHMHSHARWMARAEVTEKRSRS